MAMEAIAAVEEAEATAARRKAEAVQQARQLLSSSESRGQEAVKAALQKAESVLRDVEKEADARIAANADRIRAETNAEMEALRARAQERLGNAAEKIVERIVNG